MHMEWSMPNFHNFEGKLVQFTNAEEAELAAKKQSWIDGAAARAWQALRRERDNKIVKSDWRANSDVAMSDAWKTYRQALRDLPSTLNDTTVQETITWPDEPS